MDHSQRMEARTSVAIEEADGRVATLRTLNDEAEFTKDLSIATHQGFQYVRRKASNLEAQHASLRADHTGVSDRVVKLENAVKIGCMMIVISALHVVCCSKAAAAVFILLLEFFPIQDKCMLIFGGALCGYVATCAMQLSNGQHCQHI
ncbi:TPA: hypothetical protein ACH3X1_010929 [Trebouxia sp. C0004]